MAKILQNGNGDRKTYTIAGLTTTEFFTLFGVIETQRNKAADPVNKDYESTKNVLALCNMIEEEFKNKIKL